MGATPDSAFDPTAADIETGYASPVSKLVYKMLNEAAGESDEEVVSEASSEDEA